MAYQPIRERRHALKSDDVDDARGHSDRNERDATHRSACPAPLARSSSPEEPRWIRDLFKIKATIQGTRNSRSSTVANRTVGRECIREFSERQTRFGHPAHARDG